MKKFFYLFSLMAMVILLSTACAKKTIESQAVTDQMAEQSTTAQPDAKATDAEQGSSQPLADDRMQSDPMATHDRFINEHVHFDFDSATLRSDALEILRAKVEFLEGHPDINAVLIEGHCDERGTEAYNMALGASRAKAVRTYMVGLGINASKLQTVSYGEEKPLALGHDEEAWSRNRRASFLAK